jgi:hypothetical protein
MTRIGGFALVVKLLVLTAILASCRSSSSQREDVKVVIEFQDSFVNPGNISVDITPEEVSALFMINDKIETCSPTGGTVLDVGPTRFVLWERDEILDTLSCGTPDATLFEIDIPDSRAEFLSWHCLERRPPLTPGVDECVIEALDDGNLIVSYSDH